MTTPIRLSVSSATPALGARYQEALAFFNADPSEYAVIFTQNASGALKLDGLAANFADVYRLLRFAGGFLDRRA